MTRLRNRSRLFLPFLALVGLIALAVLVAACTGDEAGSTTSSSMGTPGSGNETSGAGSVTASTGPTPPTTGATPGTGGATPGTGGATPPTAPNAVPPSTPPGSNGGDVSQTPAQLEAVVKQSPTDRGALEQLGIAYYQAKQYDKAEATYLKRLDLEDSAEIRNNLGNVYRDWGKREKAIAEYEKAIALDPSLVYPYSNLAQLYMMTGDNERAIKIAQAGIEKTSGAARGQLQALLDALE